MTTDAAAQEIADRFDAARIAAEIIDRGEHTDPFVAVTRATRMPIVITDPRLPDNPIVFANDSFCALTGYAREEVIGRNWRFLDGPETSETTLAAIATAFDIEGPLTIDVLSYRKSGVPFWNRLLMGPVLNPAGTIAYYFASMLDVTEERGRVTALEAGHAALLVESAGQSQARHDSEERLRFATEAGQLGLWEVDFATYELTASPIFRRNFGFDADAPMTNDDARAVIHPDDRDRVRAAVAATRERGEFFDIEFRVVRADGIAWLHQRARVVHGPDGTALRIAGTSLDITARKAADAALALGAESLRLATEAASIGTWDLDLATGILTWDPLTKAMFGMPADAPCSMDDYYNGLHPDDSDAASAAFAASLDPAVRALYDVEYRTIGRDDGVCRWVAARGRGIFDGDRCVRAVGTAIDITRRRRAAAREAFLLRVSDHIRDLADPEAIIDTTMAALGDELAADRVGYGQVQEGDATAIVRSPFSRDMPPFAGVFAVGAFGPTAIGRTRAGRTVVVADVATDPDFDAAPWLAIGVRAFVLVPLIRDGRLRANLFVHRREPTVWDDGDVALIEEVAARTWEAVERTRAEADRHASEARLQAVIDAAPIGLIFASAEGTIVAGNAQVERLFRHPVLPSPDVAHYDEYVAFHADGRQVASHEYPLARALAGEERPELEPLYRRGDGTLAYIRFIAAPIRGPGGAITGGVVASLDIDRERRAELRQRVFLTLGDRVRPLTDPRAITTATADVLGRHLGVSRVGFAEVDEAAATVTYDGSFTDGVAPIVGSFALDAFGRGNIADLRRGETLVAGNVATDPRTAMTSFPAMSTCAAVVVPLVRSGRLRAVLYVNHREVRDWRTDEVTLVEEVAARSWDAVERARAEAALRELNATLERRVAETAADRDAVWQESRDLLLVIDEAGMIHAVNPAWTETLGYAADDLIGHRYSEFTVSDDIPASDAALGTIAGKPLRDFENRYRHADGSIRYLAWTAAEANGRLYCVARDMTEQKAAARELETAQEALRQAQKMEAVGQLTGGIAHDFNNMLSVVLGSLDLLGRRLGDGDPRARRYVDAATDGARRAATLTQRLLAFSRRQPLQPEPIDVNRLVAGMSDLLRGSLGGGIQLETVLGAGLWLVNADPNQLENVVLNLAINARDAMGGDGRVTVETHNCHLDDRYVAAEIGIAAGQYVLIAVTDEGGGMPPEVIAKAFDPFFTTKTVGKGTGLGLSQVYGFVRQSGGHVKIYSEVGVGTTVKLYLPRLVGVAAPAAAGPATAPVGGDAHELILVVEDEPGVRAVSVEALRELGYRVIEADGARAALQLLEAHPDVVLMFTDIVMPETNGAKLAEAARALRPGLKVLFTTGYTRNAVVHNGVVDAGVELIGKPFTVEALAAKVRGVLDGV